MKDQEIEKLTNQLQFATSQWRAACDMVEDMKSIAVIFGVVAMLACLALAGVCVWLLCQ